MATLVQVADIRCSVCEGKSAKLFCYDCEHYLCQQCEIFHKKFPSTKLHRVANAHQIDKNALKDNLVCKDHSNDFAYFCQTCDGLICSICVTTKHDGHKLKLISETALEARKNVKRRIEGLKEQIDTIEHLIDDVKSSQHKIGNNSERFKEQVKTISTECAKIVGTVLQMHLTRANDYYQLENQELQETIESLRRLSDENTLLCGKLENILTFEHDVLLILNQKSLIALKCEEIPLLEEPRTIEFDKAELIQAIFEKLETKYTKKQNEMDLLRDKLQMKDNEIAALKKSHAEELATLQKTIEKERKRFDEEQAKMKELQTTIDTQPLVTEKARHKPFIQPPTIANISPPQITGHAQPRSVTPRGTTPGYTSWIPEEQLQPQQSYIFQQQGNYYPQAQQFLQQQVNQQQNYPHDINKNFGNPQLVPGQALAQQPNMHQQQQRLQAPFVQPPTNVNVRPPQQRMPMKQQPMQQMYPVMYMPPSQSGGNMNSYAAPIIVQSTNPQMTQDQLKMMTQPQKREKKVLQIVDSNTGKDILSDYASQRTTPPSSTGSGSRGQTPNDTIENASPPHRDNPPRSSIAAQFAAHIAATLKPASGEHPHLEEMAYPPPDAHPQLEDYSKVMPDADTVNVQNNPIEKQTETATSLSANETIDMHSQNNVD